MANQLHLEVLNRGVEAWNKWREDNPRLIPDFKDADLIGIKLLGADLSFSQFHRAQLSFADLRETNLSNTNLSRANLWDADLRGATLRRTQAQNTEMVRTNLRGAKIKGVDFYEANLRSAYFAEAEIKSAFFENSLLIRTNFENAKIIDCYIHGASVWEVKLDGAIQRNLKMGPLSGPHITIDSLEVAQFIYLLLKNQKIRDVINSVTSKVVLILGRFTEERKLVLDSIRDCLRSQDYVPVLFDFDPSNNRDLTETIITLASLSKFVIADITDPKSIPQELSHIIPNLPSVPIQPVILATEREYGMFEHWRSYPWVLPEFRYNNLEHLIENLDEHVIKPAISRKSTNLGEENARLRKLLTENGIEIT